MPIFTQAVMEAAPAVRMRSIKKGGKSIQAPMALSERQRIKRGITWIVEASKKKPGKTVSERVAREVIAVLRGQSSVLETKTKSHQLAMVNRLGRPRSEIFLKANVHFQRCFAQAIVSARKSITLSYHINNITPFISSYHRKCQISV